MLFDIDQIEKYNFALRNQIHSSFILCQSIAYLKYFILFCVMIDWKTSPFIGFPWINSQWFSHNSKQNPSDFLFNLRRNFYTLDVSDFDDRIVSNLNTRRVSSILSTINFKTIELFFWSFSIHDNNSSWPSMIYVSKRIKLAVPDDIWFDASIGWQQPSGDGRAYCSDWLSME